MDTLKTSGSPFITAFAIVAVTVTIASAGWLLMGAGNVSTPKKTYAVTSGIEGNLTLKEWHLLAK